MGAYRIKWSSTPVTPHPSAPVKAGSAYSNAGYQVGLYAVDAQLLSGEKRLARLRFLQVGYQPLIDGMPYSYLKNDK